MLAAERRRAILQVVRSGAAVSTERMARQFEVSHETVRRDLTSLERAGLLSRVHGGATSMELLPAVEPAFQMRAAANEEAKTTIADLACGLLRPGHVVFIDVGTTALAVARAVPASWSGTVFTTSLRVATALAEHPGIDVAVSGGRVRLGDLALSGAHARAFFEQAFVDLAFIGCGGVDARTGVTDYIPEEIDVRRTVIDHAREVWLLAESSKVGKVAPYVTVGAAALTGLVTDAHPEPVHARPLSEAGVRLLAAPAPSDGS